MHTPPSVAAYGVLPASQVQGDWEAQVRRDL